MQRVKTPSNALIELVEADEIVYLLHRKLSGTDKQMAESLRLVTESMPNLTIADPDIFVTRIGASNHGTPIRNVRERITARNDKHARRFRITFPDCTLRVTEPKGRISYQGPIPGFVALHTIYDDVEVGKRHERRTAATQRQRTRRALLKDEKLSPEFRAKLKKRFEPLPMDLKPLGPSKLVKNLDEIINPKKGTAK